MNQKSKPARNYVSGMLALKCPRCRQGDLFVHKNPYKRWKLSYMLEMNKKCSVCGQQFELETGFWYGTGYVSYGLTVALSVATFIAWWILIGFSVHDDRLFYWLIANAIIIIGLQPWLMRLSRSLYIYLFVRYDHQYDLSRESAGGRS